MPSSLTTLPTSVHVSGVRTALPASLTSSASLVPAVLPITLGASPTMEPAKLAVDQWP